MADGAALSPMFMSPAAVYPSLPTLNLSEEEQGTATWLAQRLFSVRPYLELRGYYYDGMQRMQDLGISIPPQLKGLRTVVGWPAMSNRSLTEIGMPASGGSATPAARSRSIASAAARASLP